ncbi:MAG: hypothetical protein S4CHLAM45_02250 [Chlamydiales bacterium]|nr:hypothetical protein [Chlamydiales bacterium]MCH9622346.1 hypothetical protein [Chlamydiales bacterium]
MDVLLCFEMLLKDIHLICQMVCILPLYKEAIFSVFDFYDIYDSIISIQ